MNTTLDHNAATDTLAASRYVLGEMSEQEAQAFEEHFFECPVCAREVGETASFADNARVALRSAPARTTVVSFRDRFASLRIQVALPLAAALVLGCVAVYQGAFVIPRLERAAEPRAVAPTILRGVRSVIPVVEIEPGAASFVLIVDLTSPRTFPDYLVEFRDAAGEIVATIETAAPDTGTLHLVLPVDRFPAGDYSAVLSGRPDRSSPAETLETYPFRVASAN